MEIKNGMHFVGNKNGREIVIINATPATVTYRDLEHATVFTVGRAMFEHCDIRAESAETAPESTPAQEWDTMSDTDKFSALKAACSAACALKPANVRAAGGCKPAELVGDAWIRLETRLQSGDPRPLRDQLLFAALDALRQEARENTHSVGGSVPERAGGLDAGPAETARCIRMKGATARPVEDAGEIRDAINAAAGDDIDAAIIRGAAAGYTSDDIGAVIGMSGQAVRKRLSAIRARIAAYRDATGAAMLAYR